MKNRNLWRRLSLLAWLFPIAGIVIGWLFSPLHAAIGAGAVFTTLTPGLLVQVLLMAGWLLLENFFATSRGTAIGQLQADAVLSIGLSLVLSFGAGWLLARSQCPWYYMVPAVAAIADSFMTAYQGLNTAAQRRLIAQESDSHI